MNSIPTHMVEPLRNNNNTGSRDISHAFASFARANAHAFAGTCILEGGAIGPCPAGQTAPADDPNFSTLGTQFQGTTPGTPPPEITSNSGSSLGTPSAPKEDKKKSSSKKSGGGGSSKKKDDKQPKTDTSTPPASTTPTTDTTTTTTTSQTPVADGINDFFGNMFKSFCGSGKGIDFLCKDQATFTMFAFAFLFAIVVYFLKRH